MARSAVLLGWRGGDGWSGCAEWHVVWTVCVSIPLVVAMIIGAMVAVMVQ